MRVQSLKRPTRLALLVASFAALAAPTGVAAQSVPLPERHDLTVLARATPDISPTQVQSRTSASGVRINTVLAAAAGSLAGAAAGYYLPGVMSPDDCQETCAGMWVTIPAGSILGGALGAKLAGTETRNALIGSLVGFASGMSLALVAPNTPSGEFVFVAIHGFVTALWAERHGG